jgi:hypothetical protein
MFFRRYYLGCPSHASYLIGDTTTGRASTIGFGEEATGVVK